MIKVERSQPAPKSLAIEKLKSNGSYTKPDVVERLKQDFNNKCYICELKNLQDPQVEHLLPKHKYPEKKFDWSNLFWVCSHCNSIKNQDKYDDGIIDCCIEDPELLLDFIYNNNEIKVNAIDEHNMRANLTAELIYETFNKKNTGIRIAKCEMRIRELQEEMNILFGLINKYLNTHSSLNEKKLIASLRKESAFASFKRAYIRKILDNFPILKSLVY